MLGIKPQHPGQKTYPKKQFFENYNDQYIKEVQYKINRRPREKLGFLSSKELFFVSLEKKLHWQVEFMESFFIFIILKYAKESRCTVKMLSRKILLFID